MSTDPTFLEVAHELAAARFRCRRQGFIPFGCSAGSWSQRAFIYTITVDPVYRSYASSDEFRFRRDGRFVRRRSSGGTISSGVALDGYSASTAVSSTPPSLTGHYRIADGKLLLRYDDGRDEQLAFRRDEGLIWLNRRQYVRTGDWS